MFSPRPPLLQQNEIPKEKDEQDPIPGINSKEVNEISSQKIRVVTYDTENHFAVLTQMHGSVWPRVIPYCICNVLITALIYYLKFHRNIDLTFSDKGHSFMSLLVSFLVVTRSNIAYARFMEARSHLQEAMKSCRELVQLIMTFTRYDTSPSAKVWRATVSRRTVVLLRTIVSVLEYQTKQTDAWKVPELTKEEKQAVLLSVGKSNERTPIVLILFLRSAIASQREFLQEPMHINKELKLHAFVSNFVTAYHGLMKLITTPFPFPLVQMARTFLFIWIFSLPFVLVRDVSKLPALSLLIFFITYGFVGLEFVSIELDDPYGDDPNDFDVMGLAKVVFDDIYVAVYDVDGKDAATSLKKNVEAPLDKLRKTEAQRHRRYASVDAWNDALPSADHKVGSDRNKLLTNTNAGHNAIDIFGGAYDSNFIAKNSNEQNVVHNHTSLTTVAELDLGAILEERSSFDSKPSK